MQSDKRKRPAGTGRRFLEQSWSCSDDVIALAAADQKGISLAPFSKDVLAAIASHIYPNVYIFCGPNAWYRASVRRALRGAASTLVLPEYVDPLSLIWPKVDSVIVAWPGHSDLQRKLDLAQALVRDGIGSAHIQHEPHWLHVKAKVVA
jgi:hypothetical protein